MPVTINPLGPPFDFVGAAGGTGGGGGGATGPTGSVQYQRGGGTFGAIPPGATGTVLVSQGPGLAPTFSAGPDDFAFFTGQ